jgi:hypothetical protein
MMSGPGRVLAPETASRIPPGPAHTAFVTVKVAPAAKVKSESKIRKDRVMSFSNINLTLNGKTRRIENINQEKGQGERTPRTRPEGRTERGKKKHKKLQVPPRKTEEEPRRMIPCKGHIRGEANGPKQGEREEETKKEKRKKKKKRRRRRRKRSRRKPLSD